MNTTIKKGLCMLLLAAMAGLGGCKRQTTENSDESAGIPKDTSNHSESMDYGKSSDSIIRTNSADGTDSGL